MTDQNGQPLGGVWVTVSQNGKPVTAQRTTASGNAVLEHLVPGTYLLEIQLQHYYTATVDNVELAPGQTTPVEVKLQPVRDVTEEVEVTAQPSPIDPEQTSHSESISGGDIAMIPYPTTRDYRNVMAYIPGVIADNGGQIHPSGASAQEVEDYFDGFEVSQPAGGGLGLRINPDVLKKIEVRNSRFSSRFGKGSGGLVDLEAQDGDNKFRFNATNFIPTFQMVKGFHFNNWTPRAYFTGPIVRDRVWFSLSHEGEDDYNIVKELPDGADTNTVWRIADVGRLKFNLSPGNVLSATALVNQLDSNHGGISPFDPYSVSFNQDSTLGFFGLKDQFTIARETLLEFGAGYHWTRNSLVPQGNAPYLFLPSTRAGNFYLNSQNESERSQAFSNLFLKPLKFWGTHQFTFGGEVDRVLFHGDQTRGPIQFLDGAGVLLRQVTFNDQSRFSLSTVESSSYIQDRWSALERVTMEAGARWDHDSFIGRDMFSPRIAGSVMVDRGSETKLSAGTGIYYDRTNLSIVSQAFQGNRTDVYFSPVPLTIPLAFHVDPATLVMPRFVNWSAGLERRLPWRIYARFDYLSRHGSHVWAYEAQPDGTYALQTNKRDNFDGGMITIRRELKPGYPFMFSYMRSRAASNESLGFSLDNFTTGPQLPGPLFWDAPNQITSWGSFPLPSFWKFKKFDFAYSVLWHTGFPFSTVDNFARLVDPPGVHRFPAFLTLNPAIEKKFVLGGYRWAARVGLDNATNSLNPTIVDNDVNSPTFLSFSGTGHRTFNGRIRFLGKQ